MTAPTHYAFSFLVCIAAGIPPAVAIPASLLSLLPDIDHPESLVGRIVPTVSRKILQKHGHRTVTHSLFAVIILLTLAFPVLLIPSSFKIQNSALFISITLSFSSHIFLDLFNRAGVKLLAPVSQKEYISFHTPALRIPVRSWQEYLLLFFIVLLCFTVAGESFSVSKAVRSAAKIFYLHYDGALTDYENASRNWCTAKIEHFDHITAQKVTKSYLVLTMYPEKMIALEMPSDGSLDHIHFTRENRRIFTKDEIDQIEIFPSQRKVKMQTFEGHELKDLEKIPAGSLVSGTIIIKNYHPEMRNTDYLTLSRTPSTTTITLTCALPEELVDVISIETQRSREIETLKSKVSVFQIERLTAEEKVIKARLVALQQKGFYENYTEIIRLNGEIKKIESRIDTLRLQQTSGADIETQLKIETLEKGFSVEYSVLVLQK